MDNRNTHHANLTRNPVEYNEVYLMKGYDVRILNNSAWAWSQHYSAISTALTSASSIETVVITSTKSQSSFRVEDTATSVGNADIIKRVWNNEDMHTIVKKHLSASLTEYRTWLTR